MQTILGAGGDIGTLLAKELRNYTNELRLVARNPEQVNGNDELVAGDLKNRDLVFDAVKGSEITYLTVGLTYDHRVWEKEWPVIMQHAIDACLYHQSKLVFFDNVYLYDKNDLSDIRENHPVNPPSRKGEVRAKLVSMLAQAGEKSGLKYLIARSADFYGPGSKNGVLNTLVIDKVAKGEKAVWQSDDSKIHSFTYTPDAAKATAMLGNTDSAYCQVWHLPTSDEKLSGKQLIELTARLADRKPSWFVLSPWMIRVGGWFSRIIGELYEMQYQNDRDYFFNSEKFNQFFDFTPTPYETGIRATIAGIRS